MEAIFVGYSNTSKAYRVFNKSSLTIEESIHVKFEESVEKMAGDRTSMMKSVNPHPLRIDVVKFYSKKNFGMWRCEVIDALTISNLQDTLQLKKKHNSMTEEDWDKINQMAYGLIRYCLTQDIKYHVLQETSARQLCEILEKKYLTKSIESGL